ncbi:MAG: hypothetical protein ACFKPT_12055 [Gloeotrichia echinulata GP01]
MAIVVSEMAIVVSEMAIVVSKAIFETAEIEIAELSHGFIRA